MSCIDATDRTVFLEGELILLECGDYSGRSNIGLFRVKQEFEWKDMPLSDQLHINRNPFHGDWACRVRNLDSEFQAKYLEPIPYYEVNTDYLHDSDRLTDDSEGLTAAEAVQISRSNLRAKP